MIRILTVLCVLLAGMVSAQESGELVDPLEGQARQLMGIVGPVSQAPLELDPLSPVVSLNGMIELIVESDEPFIVRGYIQLLVEANSGDITVEIYEPTPVGGDIGGWSGGVLEMKGYPVDGPDNKMSFFFKGEDKFGEVRDVARLELRGQGDLASSSPHVMTGPLAGTLRLGRARLPVRGSFLAVEMR